MRNCVNSDVIRQILLDGVTLLFRSEQYIHRLAHAAEDLNRLTNNLEELISKFKINETDSQKGKTSVRSNRKLIYS